MFIVHFVKSLSNLAHRYFQGLLKNNPGNSDKSIGNQSTNEPSLIMADSVLKWIVIKPRCVEQTLS